jgi:hypothetical protein
MVFSADPNSWENDGGHFDNYTTGISDPRIVRNATPGWNYTMYYTAGPAPNNSTYGGIGAAVSNDGVNWTRVSDAPLRSAPGGFTFVIQAITIRGIRYVYYLAGGSAAQVIPPTIHVMQDSGDGIHFVNDHEVTGALSRMYPLYYDAVTDTCLMVDNLTSPSSFTLYQDSDGFTRIGQAVATISSANTGNPTNFDPMVVQRDVNGQLLRTGGTIEVVMTTGNSSSWQPVGVQIWLPEYILFQNSNGGLAEWGVANLAIATGTVVAPNPGPNCYAMAVGKFYSGGTSDILWQNTDGQVFVWQMNGTTQLGGGFVASPGTSWHVVGTGNFYRDGNTSVLWQNDNGAIALWDMKGTSIVQGQILASNPGITWHAKVTGDFYRDGNTDIVFQNDDGRVLLWEMNGATRVRGDIVAGNPGPTWRIKGVGDFYGDGHPDILWQNDNGMVAVWDMNGAAVARGAIVSGNPGPTWHIKGVADFNNDGKSDISWQNDDGSVAIWQMNGANIVSGAVLANPGTSWNLLGSDQHMRFVYSAAANETLNGNPVTPDEFVLTNIAAGTHTIAAFNPTQDVIELSRNLFGSADAVLAATTETQAGSLIHVGGSTVLIAGIDTWALHASNFALG